MAVMTLWHMECLAVPLQAEKEKQFLMSPSNW
jgi:hypothetical protein